MSSADGKNVEKENNRWYEFTQEVSMHGVRSTTLRTLHIIRRICWVVLILISFGYFLYASSTFLRDFSKKKLSTNIREERTSQLQFPTVTICNKNSWKKSAISAASERLGTEVIFEVMKDLYVLGRPTPPPMNKYNWSDPELASILALNGTSTEKLFREAAPQLKGSVIGCLLLGVLYECKDLMEVVSTDAGYCFQFNSNGTVNTTSAGRDGGISMLLYAYVDDYSMGPSSYSEGFSLTFHNWYEVPQVTQQGVGFTPGTQASVILHKSVTKRYPPPADDGRANCLDTTTEVNPLKYYQRYSYSGCQVECKTKYVLERCGCKDLLQPPYLNATTCSITDMLYCSNPALKKFVSDAEGLQACDCKDPCVDNEFIPKISSYRFPSENYIEDQLLSENLGNWWRRNVIMVDIFYGKMSYQTLEEELAYSIEDMIANVGGTLGLCIGASVLTICEFFEFGLLSLSRFCCKKKLKTPKKSLAKVVPVDIDNDNRMF